MGMKFTNNASTTLASGISAVATSLTVQTGAGALFPVLGAGDYFYCTLSNTSGNVEIIKVSARTGDVFNTIVRAQDNTTALVWNAGDRVELRLVSASLNDFPKLDEVNTFSLAQTFTTAPVFTDQAGTRAAAGAAASGANTDITSVLSSVSAMTLIASATANNSATIDFTSIANGTYNSYLLVGDEIVPSTNLTYLILRVSIGGVFQSTANNYYRTTFRYAPTGTASEGEAPGGGATAIAIASTGDPMGTGADQVFNFNLRCGNMGQATGKKHFMWQTSSLSAAGTVLGTVGSGAFAAANTAVDGFRLLMNSGNIASGTFKLYGIKA